MTPYDDRLDRLAATAARVFATKGFHSTTMRDLARETGMSLAGMYHYVRSKDELLFLIQDRCFRAVLRGARAAVADSSDPIERLERRNDSWTVFANGQAHKADAVVIATEAFTAAKLLEGFINKDASERLKRTPYTCLLYTSDAADE